VRKPAIPTDDGVRTFAHPDVGRGTVRSGDAPPQCPIRTDYSRTTMKSVREEDEEEEGGEAEKEEAEEEAASGSFCAPAGPLRSRGKKR